MANDETTRPKTVAQQQETIFISRMVRIVDQTGALVRKSGLCLLERDAVLCQVGLSFTAIPGKINLAHIIILAISATCRGRLCSVRITFRVGSWHAVAIGTTQSAAYQSLPRENLDSNHLSRSDLICLSTAAMGLMMGTNEGE